MSTDTAPAAAFLSITDFARAVGASSSSVSRQVRSGRIPAVQVTPGGPWKIPAEHVDQLRALAYERVRTVPVACDDPAAVVAGARAAVRRHVAGGGRDGIS